MVIKAASIDEYMGKLPEDRREAVAKLREIIRKNLPPGFTEEMSYGTPGFVVPHSAYPAGYHCKPEEPLPFISIASQKHFVAVYHMGVYAYPEILEWFTAEFPKHSERKLDMGKSCIRFSNVNRIPFDLIGELCSKITMEEWISIYEKHVKKSG
jgi:uncharacterized protein YdhG (YjbR/CyaY superfamily)